MDLLCLVSSFPFPQKINVEGQLDPFLTSTEQHDHGGMKQGGTELPNPWLGALCVTWKCNILNTNFSSKIVAGKVWTTKKQHCVRPIVIYDIYQLCKQSNYFCKTHEIHTRYIKLSKSRWRRTTGQPPHRLAARTVKLSNSTTPT